MRSQIACSVYAMSTADSIQLGIFIVGVVAAGTSIWMAVLTARSRGEARTARDEARAAKKDAETARDTAVRSLGELAKHAEEQARNTRPIAWSMPIQRAGDGWAVQNSSRRDIVLMRVDAEPAVATPLLDLKGAALPREVPNGSTVEFNSYRRMEGSADRVVLVWRFDSDPPDVEYRSPRELRR